MPRHILYIINPIAGTGVKKDLREIIEKKTKEAGIAFQVVTSVVSGDYTFLLPLLSQEKVTDVVIAAGDGTVSQVVHSLMEADVNFGIIPCGSGNGLAFAAKIPRSVLDAMDIIFNGKAAPIDGFYINDRFACMLCGLGFDAKVAHDFARQPKRGLSSYVRQVIRNFFSAKPYRFDIHIDDQAFTVEAFFISIANSNQFGNHFTIAPQASLADGLLDIVIVTKQNKLSLLIQTFKQIRGKNELQQVSVIQKRKAIIYFQAAALRITNRSQAPMHMDGDPVVSPNEISIRIHPNCFRLIQP